MNQKKQNMKHSLKKTLAPFTPPIVWELYRKQRLKKLNIKIPKREFLLPEISLEELFPEITKIRPTLPGTSALIDGIQTLPPKELITLGLIAAHLKPEQIFEFGTYTGLSTLTMAINSPKSQIYTLDLDPEKRPFHAHGSGVGGFSPFQVGLNFLATPEKNNIKQLYADSANFNFEQFSKSMNFIFIDADHSYDFVHKDTINAFAMLAPKGIILWDDYIWNEEFPECEGVARTLHELMNKKSIFRIAGTRWAIYINA